MTVWLTYSLLALCAAVFAGSFWLSTEKGEAKFPKVRKFAGPLQVAALIGVYLVLRPGAGDDGVADLKVASAAGQTTFVDLYSNY